MSDISPLSKAELAAARAAAERGEILPLETLHRAVATLRKSYLAVPAASPSKKSRVKSAPVSEDQVDFF